MSFLQEKYERLFHKASSPKSIDYGKCTIYDFNKFCRCCGQGLVKANKWDKKNIQKLWKKSFCSENCLSKGKRQMSSFPMTVKGSIPGHKNEHLVEEVAFLSLDVKKEMEDLNPIARLVQIAHKSFSLLSEKLRFMEVETGEIWGESKFYYWLSKAAL